MTLFHRVRGKGEPVVLLHGLFGSADNLGALARSLESEYMVISPDLRNHGRSFHEDEISYPLMAGDVLELMDELGLETVRIFGHSMGGKTAMQIALDAPDRVHRLVVGDIAPVKYGAHHALIFQGMQAVADKAPENRAEAGRILASFVREKAVSDFLLTNWSRKENNSWGWRINLSALTRNYDHIAAANEGRPCNKQVLFLRGELSDYIKQEHTKQIMSLFPQATVRTVKGSGHWLHAEKPDMVSRIIKQFFPEDTVP